MEISVVVGEVVPSMVMVAMEFFTICLTILASTVISKGMSPFVFVVYTNALGSILLIFYCFFFDRDQTEKPRGLTFRVYFRIFFLGLIGITIVQNLAFLGLSYSSPIVACGMGNLIPAFSFILSIILRRTKIDWKRAGSQVKLVGTLISIVGATSLTLYRGTVVKNSPFSSFSFLQQPHRLFIFTSTTQGNWILGCILYAAASLALSACNIIQAIFGSIVRIRVNLWCTQLKGPLFGSIFKPVGIPIASMFGCFLFADTFHYGSMMGAVACGLGYYTLIWGQITDGESDRMPKDSRGLPPSDEKVPLLEEEDSPV